MKNKITQLLRRLATEKTIKPVSFEEEAIQVIRKTKAQGRYSTADNYLTALRALRQFRGQPLMPDEISAGFIDDFCCWLQVRRLSINTISCYLSSLRALYRKIDTKEQGEDPFRFIRTGKSRSQKNILTADDLHKLRALPLREGCHLAFVRDIFLFCFYAMGMPFVDVAHLETRQIRNGRIYYKRHKTLQPVTVALEPFMMEIIRRYHIAGSPYVFPILSGYSDELGQCEYRNRLRGYNASLKVLAKRAGIAKQLSSYVVRHTWASMAYQADVALPVISKALGHTNTSTTLLYIKGLDDARIADANHALLRKIWGDKDDNVKITQKQKEK